MNEAAPRGVGAALALVFLLSLAACSEKAGSDSAGSAGPRSVAFDHAGIHDAQRPYFDGDIPAIPDRPCTGGRREDARGKRLPRSVDRQAAGDLRPPTKSVHPQQQRVDGC